MSEEDRAAFLRDIGSIEPAVSALQDAPFTIRNNSSDETEIKSTLDLYYWLSEHPVRASMTTKINFADPVFLGAVIRKMAGKQTVKPKEIYDAIESLQSVYDYCLNESVFNSPAAATQGWNPISLDLSGTNVIMCPPSVRREPDFTAVEGIGPRTFLGRHFTTYENVMMLLENGPSALKSGSGNGTGKGAGFYIVPDSKDPLIKWGPVAVRVYMTDPEIINKDSVPSGELERIKSEKIIRYGSDEIVIPPSLFPNIYLVLQEDFDAYNAQRGAGAHRRRRGG